MSSSKLRLSKLALGLTVALAAAPVFAQSTSSGIAGRITTDNGQAVAGAEVTITHVESGTTSRTTTDANGRYAANGLRPGGPYVVKVHSAAGDKAQSDVFLTLNNVAQVDETVGASGNDLGKVTVTGRATAELFNPDKKGLSTNISGRRLETTPSGNRSLDDVARLDPRINVTDPSDGSISMAGLPNRYNNISVDGLGQGDPFGLNSNGMPYTGSPISRDTIAAYNISTTDFDVGSDTVGANVNAVTKSGTNQFHGSLYGAYKNANSMVGTYPNGGGHYTGFGKDMTYGFTVGGPIIKDRLFFFLAAEKETITKLGTPPSTGLQAGKVTQAEIDAVSQAATKWGLTPGNVVSSGQDLNNKRYLAKIDWNISDKHRASLTLQRTSETKPTPYDQSSSSVVFSSHWYNVNSLTKNAALQLFSDWTSNFSTEAKVSYQKFDQIAGNAINQPHIQVFTPEGGTIYLGEDQFRHENEIHTKKWTGSLIGTLLLGSHTIKGGFDYQRTQVGDLFGRRLHGFYVFNTAADFANGIYMTTGSNQAQRTYIPAGESLGDIAGTWTYSQLSPFIQDSWQVTDKFSLVYGVRVNLPKADHAPPLNPNYAAVTGFPNNSTLGSKNKVVEPRIGFNYLINSKNLMQLRGGAGIFQTVPPVVWMTNPYLNNGVTSLITVPVTAPFGTVVNDVSNKQAASSVNPVGAQIDAITPNFKLPTALKASLAFDAALPMGGLIGSIEYQYIKARNAILYTEPNVGVPSTRFLMPDGRQSYWSTALGTGVNNGRNPAIAYNSTLLGNTNKGESNSLTLALTKPTNKFGFSGNFSATFTHATEVNPGNSSQANSNYQVAMVNPNENIAPPAARGISRSIKATASWEHAFFGDYKTSVSAYYNGRTGSRYSWIYGSGSGILGDVNGDNQSGYDLAYIPNVNDSRVVYVNGTGAGAPAATAAQIAAFQNYIDQDPYLHTHRGQIASRNSSVTPWSNQLDLGIQQEFPGFFKGNKSVVRLDVSNFLNLLNRNWGVTQVVSASNGSFNARRTLAYVSGFTATGQYKYDLSKTPDSLQTYYLNGTSGVATRPVSLWSVMLTVKYTF
ncbi:TonB-dependent receptor [Solilutibacter silvestris]|uniref:Carboxypeptidase regulatory-like protein n=1 Tax=Solilutibacter silvestris TaxID=1645665 RepID=A0A2K1Q382_9GAMM|nr:TonB-dependent receptor [Lysobacter silvestris]PNS09461.1 Carboxypeptidase regulatory-like protein [Lysobacter silvestris]